MVEIKHYILAAIAQLKLVDFNIESSDFLFACFLKSIKPSSVVGRIDKLPLTLEH